LTLLLGTILALAGILSRGQAAPPAGAESRESLTILAGLPEGPDGSSGMMPRLAELLGEAVSARVRLTWQPLGGGVLAANRLSLAHPDGSLLGIFPLSAVITRTAENRTPYILDNFEPVFLPWSQPQALLAPRAAPFSNLDQLAAAPADQKITLYHSGLDPMEPGTLLALALARRMNIFDRLELAEKENLSPEILSGGVSVYSLLAWPLDQLNQLNQPDQAGQTDQTNQTEQINQAEQTDPAGQPGRAAAGRYKIIAVLADSYQGPCAPAGLDLQSQGRPGGLVADHTGFFYPANPIQQEAAGMAQILSELNRRPELTRMLDEKCLAPGRLDPEKTREVLLKEFTAQAGLLAALAKGRDLDRSGP
jgi:tripartite-type tricarboxylate transporter receptor subunit TctC